MKLIFKNLDKSDTQEKSDTQVKSPERKPLNFIFFPFKQGVI
jgi:hypothetical protein